MNYTNADKDVLRSMFDNMMQMGAEKFSTIVEKNEHPIMGDSTREKVEYRITLKKIKKYGNS